MAFDSFYIVTPVFNAEKTIERTIKSILQQTYPGKVYYHIQDGVSTDGTLDVIKNVLSNTEIPDNIMITTSTEKDSGMYDAIHKGFSKFDNLFMDSDWFTWINADDYLELNALSDIHLCSKTYNDCEIKWISGRVSILNLNGTFTRNNYDLHNSYIISNGVADGNCWSFLQQEGTFFRAECYYYALKKNAFRNLKYAGDWNLWRVLALRYRLYLVSKPLGNFCRTVGQLSQLHREKYEQEIESLVSYENKIHFIKKDHSLEDLNALIFDILDNKASLRHHSLKGHLAYRKDLLHKRELEHAKAKQDAESIAKKVVVDNNHIFLDLDWQYPARTEQNAYERLKKLKISGDVCLVSFPWATYIDLVNNKKIKAKSYEQALTKIKDFTKNFRVVLTVCQHVLFEKYLDIFKDLNITDVFWSHDIKEHSSLAKNKGIKTHPMPLFAVNVAENNSARKRDILFNFIGAKADQYYLTDTRNLIFRMLADTPNAIVSSRDSWHFHELVYTKQINQLEELNPSATNVKAEEFKNVLARSIFTLCPSGSGANSIRLWESIGSGSIPVILADTYLPPGDISLWHEAVLFCEENEESIQKLPETLKALANDEKRLNSMRHAMKQLWLLYGPETFINDVEDFIRVKSTHCKTSSIVKKKINFSFLDFLLTQDVRAIPNNVLVSSFLVRLLVSPSEFIEYYQSTLNENIKIKELLKSAVYADKKDLLGKRLRSIGITYD